MRTHALPIALAGAAVSMLLTGCIGFDGEPTGKQIGPNKVEIKFTTCEGNDTPDCSDQKAAEERAANEEEIEARGGDEQRVLSGIRTPHGTKLPRTFHAVDGNDPDLTFTRDRSYTDALNLAAPRPNGSIWVGYTSTQQDFKTKREAGGIGLTTFKLVARLSDDIGRQFKFRPVLGLTEQQPGTPIDCGKGSQVYEFNDNDTICIDAPDSYEETRRSIKVPLD